VTTEATALPHAKDDASTREPNSNLPALFFIFVFEQEI